VSSNKAEQIVENNLREMAEANNVDLIV
jgi:hypothetical protein